MLSQLLEWLYTYHHLSAYQNNNLILISYK